MKRHIVDKLAVIWLCVPAILYIAGVPRPAAFVHLTPDIAGVAVVLTRLAWYFSLLYVVRRLANAGDK